MIVPRRSSTLLCVILALTTACTDETLPVQPDGPSLNAARQPGLPVVNVRPDAPAGAQGALVDNIPDAIARVRPGGTIRVHAGTYLVREIQIDKPLTIEGVGSARPVFDAEGGGNSFGMNGMDAGPVVLRGIVFRNTYGDIANPDGYWFASLSVIGTYDSILIEDSEFYPADPPNPTPGWEDAFDGNGVYVSGQGNGITVRRSTFVGGDIGLHGSALMAGWHVEDSRFVGQANGGIHSGGSGRFEGNNFGPCGPVCLTLGSSTGEYEVIGNDFRIDAAGSTEMAIWTSGARVEVVGNTIVGTGGSADPDDPASWPITFAGISLYQVRDAIVSRNTVSRARGGLWFDQTTARGVDNVIDDVAVAIGAWGPPEGPVFNNIAINRTDMTRYDRAVEGGYTFESADLTCNWWGDAAGPHHMPPDIPVDAYTPWATAPIAGTGDACE